MRYVTVEVVEHYTERKKYMIKSRKKGNYVVIVLVCIFDCKIGRERDREREREKEREKEKTRKRC